MANKFYRVQMNPETKTSICPVCDHTNNHIADAGNCEHLHKLTTKGVAMYFWGIRPICEAHFCVLPCKSCEIQNRIESFSHVGGNDWMAK